jgi:hypothetical protein
MHQHHDISLRVRDWVGPGLLQLYTLGCVPETVDCASAERLTDQSRLLHLADLVDSHCA